MNPAEASRAPRVLFTVDVEVGRGHDPQARLWGRCEGGECGVEYQLERFRAHGIGATFFVNVYEAKPHGAALFREVCRTIERGGGEVQLHTHPDGWTQDATRRYMWQYSPAEQQDLLRTGIGMIGEWTGRAPVAHRAGSLAANDETLDACARSGLEIDSSYAYGWGPCRMDRPFALRNTPYRHGSGVLEVPVTTFQDLPPLRHVRHVDINAASLEELQVVLGETARDPRGALVVLMHSFSFVERNGRGYGVKRGEREKFERFLEAVRGSACAGVPISTLLRRESAAELPASAKPSPMATGFWLTYRRSLGQMHRSRKALALVAAPWVLVLVAALGVWAALSALGG